jgi:hypothetical protein
VSGSHLGQVHEHQVAHTARRALGRPRARGRAPPSPLLVFSRQIIGCETTLPTSAIILRFLPFSNRGRRCAGRNQKGPLRTQFVAKPTSCLIDCCVQLFCIIREDPFILEGVVKPFKIRVVASLGTAEARSSFRWLRLSPFHLGSASRRFCAPGAPASAAFWYQARASAMLLGTLPRPSLCKSPRSIIAVARPAAAALSYQRFASA